MPSPVRPAGAVRRDPAPRGDSGGGRKTDVRAAAAGHKAGQRAGGKGKRPTVTGSAVQGAAGGAMAGSSLGPQGAVIGAVAGGAGGAAAGRKAKRQYRAQKRASLGPARQLLVAEFVVCIIISAFSPLTRKHADQLDPGKDAAVKWIKQGTAICGLFLVLSLISAAGKGAAKMAAGFGGIVTMALLLNDRDIFTVLATKVSGGAPSSELGPGSSDWGNIAASGADSIGDATRRAANALRPSQPGLSGALRR
jgi:hypothetical protein